MSDDVTKKQQVDPEKIKQAIKKQAVTRIIKNN